MQVTTSLASGQVSVLPLGHGPVKLGLSSVRPSSLTFSHVYSSLAKLQFDLDQVVILYWSPPLVLYVHINKQIIGQLYSNTQMLLQH
jgi:putative exporter of polyketide antibiotics